MELKNKMDYIKRCIEHLDRIRRDPGPERLPKSFLALTSTLYTLQTAIQALTDMGLRFVAEKGGKPPQQYGDLGEALMGLGVFTASDSTLLRKIAGFRNIVVHRYLGISMQLLKNIIRDRLYLDIARLALKILEAAEQQGLDP